MKQMLLCISLLCGHWLLAQSVVQIEPATVSKEITVDLSDRGYEEVSKVTVRNTSLRLLQLRWDQIVVRQPGGWEMDICKNLNNAPPFVTTAASEADRSVTLAPGASFDLYLTVKPGGEAGEAVVEVPLYLAADASKVHKKAVFNIQINNRATPPPATTADNDNNTIRTPRLYPNPAIDRFYVATPRNTTVGRIEVTNTLGRRVRSYDGVTDSTAYDVSDLPEGVYLVALYDDRGKIIRTLRLLRRNWRP